MPWIDWFKTEEGDHLPEGVAHWVVVFGRIGYASRGLIYSTIGVLAVMAALGVGGELAGAQAAMEIVGELPLGKVIVAITAAGLAGYALWRIAQGVFNLEKFEPGWAKRCYRLYFVFDGIFHGAFAVFIFMALGSVGGAQQEEEEARAWTARVMEWPAGVWLIGLTGVLTGAAGIYLIVRVFMARFRKTLAHERLPQVATTTAVLFGRIGEGARGLVFLMIGAFLVRAALSHDPDETRGLAATFAKIYEQPYGRWLLALVAAGFLAYGLYSLFESRYRHIGKGLADDPEADNDPRAH